MAPRTQDNSIVAISDFSLGKDTFLLSSFTGSEHLSGFFEFQADVYSETLDIAPNKVVGKNGTITVQNEHGRVFNGYVRAFSVGEVVHHDLRQYRLTLVPWTWFLTKTRGNRIFQNQSTQDIVKTIFSDAGFNDFECRGVSGPPREYCVQYAESDWDFVSRLLEEDGAAYYFKHVDGKHTLIITDQLLGAEATVETDLLYGKGASPDAIISTWEHIYEFKKGQWSLNDYAFKSPKKDLLVNTKTTSDFAKNSQYEHYEYGSLGLHDMGGASKRADQRLEAEEVSRNLVAGVSSCTTFFPGATFKVSKHEAAAELGKYTLIEVQHAATVGGYFPGEKVDSTYTNNFVAMPADIQFRPMQTTPRPMMKGPQSAVVVGPSGEEIYVDEFGRIKVQFIWDREGKKDENSTCYIRVMQSWAGNQWGSSFIPRIGHEVIVNFLEGDPDRPIVTGSVYNGWNKPPFESKTQSGIKTRSTKKGTAQNFNEFRFDDKKGAEQIFIHAEKNMDTEVENDETLTVDNNRTKHVKNNETSNIDVNRSKTVGKNETIDIGQNKDETIGKNNSVSVGDNHSETIGANMTITVDKNLIEKVKVDYTEDVDKNKKSTIGKDLTENIGANHTVSVKKNAIVKADKVQITAKTEISFKCGSASILMKKNGDITIKGKKINVKGSGDIILKGSNIKEN